MYNRTQGDLVVLKLKLSSSLFKLRSGAVISGSVELKSVRLTKSFMLVPGEWKL